MTSFRLQNPHLGVTQKIRILQPEKYLLLRTLFVSTSSPACETGKHGLLFEGCLKAVACILAALVRRMNQAWLGRALGDSTM
jgi:hypothetical protein